MARLRPTIATPACLVLALGWLLLGALPLSAQVASAPPQRDDWMRPWGRPDLHGAVGPSPRFAARLNRAGPLPAWVRATAEVALWSGPQANTTVFTTVPRNTVFKVLDRPRQGRVPIYYPGDGATRLAGMAWVEARLVDEGSAPEWLASSEVQDSSATVGPRRMSLEAPPRVTAAYVAVVDGDTGKLLYAQQPHARVPPASLTKIATTLVALERAGPDLSRPVSTTVSGSWMAAHDGSSIMGLEPGELVSLETLLYGMMLPSGNDAAEQVAISLGGTSERYVAWMNDLARQLELRDTRFVTPSGIDAPGHYSSAYDLAVLARAAMRNETFRQIVGSATYRGDDYVLRTINRLIGVYPGADGVKTGFTDTAGRTMVASATYQGHRVFVSILRSQDVPADATGLLDWAWRVFQW